MTADVLTLPNADRRLGHIFTALESARGRFSNHRRWRRRVRARLDSRAIGDPLIRALLEAVLESRRYASEICVEVGVCETAIMNIVNGRNPTVGTVSALLGAMGQRLAIVREGE